MLSNENITEFYCPINQTTFICSFKQQVSAACLPHASTGQSSGDESGCRPCPLALFIVPTLLSLESLSWLGFHSHSASHEWTFSHSALFPVISIYLYLPPMDIFHAQNSSILKKTNKKNQTLFPWQCSRIKMSNVHVLCPHFRNLLNGNLCTHMKKYTSNMYKYVLRKIMWGSKNA